MLVKTFLKSSAGGPDVFFYVVGAVCNCSAVYYIFVLAFALDRAVGFYPTITGGFRVIIHVQEFFVVSAYN